jgi:hypothetical protein
MSEETKTNPETKSIKLKVALDAVRLAISDLRRADEIDAVLRACLALNAPTYRDQFSCDPKPF